MVIQLPCTHKEMQGIGAVHDDMVQNQVVRAIDFRKPVPGRALIRRFINPAIRCSKVEMVRIGGIGGK